MTQTFMDTRSFQVIVTLTLATCIIGIIAAVYNGVRYHQLAKMSKSEWNNDAKQQINTAEKSSMVTGVIFLLAFIVIAAILVVNLNKSSCLEMSRGTVKPEIGTAKDLAELFD